MKVFILIAGLGIWGASCALLPDPRPTDRLTVASWNVENLFDEVDDGDEYPEFDPQHGWTRAQFWARCTALAAVIRTLGPSGPDLLFLEEVEGAHALEVLRTRFLADQGYRWSFLAPSTERGVKTAILSRYPFVRTALWSPASPGAPLRPLVEVELDLGGRSLVVLGNHWKSRIPTPVATERLRQASAQTLVRRLTALEQQPDRPFVLAVGDFNTALELSRSYADRALLPATSTEGSQAGLPVFSGRRAAEASHRPGAVWDPWETVASPPGSYLYQGRWDRLDHAFVAASSLRLGDWAFEGFTVVAYAREPQAWSPRQPQGVSDHFPLVLTLVRRGEGVDPP